ncbi:hypothetical protein GQ55_3G357900 [Panicum hallii var. hallii]|uniref:Ubiquitin-like protease family profile domain-containing protein n=1 Tax=Panicum hallii var. hallii TaxID=1504633 RepID=A0A2T7EG02_9POAL|nr:hypothetical protein GQ55_3G357900 [Panicum hallii var. hallii]
MDSAILDLQCRLWGEERDDRIILSQSVARGLIIAGSQSSRRSIRLELKEEKLENAAQIFIPLLHSKHWFLILDETVHFLDSLPTPSRVKLVLDVLLVLRNIIKESVPMIDIFNYKFRIPPVQKHGNRYSFPDNVSFYFSVTPFS